MNVHVGKIEEERLIRILTDETYRLFDISLRQRHLIRLLRSLGQTCTRQPA